MGLIYVQLIRLRTHNQRSRDFENLELCVWNLVTFWESNSYLLLFVSLTWTYQDKRSVMLISYGHIAGYNTLKTIPYFRDKPLSTNIATESSIITTKRKKCL